MRGGRPRGKPNAGYVILSPGSRIRYATQDEADEHCESSTADLILHIPRLQLGYVYRDGVRTSPPLWKPLRFVQRRILEVGLLYPGTPFGNETINRKYNTQITPRTLTRYVSEIAKLIQGGAGGPYVERKSADYEVSETGYGYLFNDQWRYEVIDFA